MEQVQLELRKTTSWQGELFFLWRLLWPGVAFIVVGNTVIQLATGAPGAPAYVMSPLAIVVMLAAAWWRDHYRPVQLPPRRELVVVGIGPEGTRQVTFGARPNPLLFLPAQGERGFPHSDMALAVLIEFCSSTEPPDVAWLERELDWYLRGKQPMRKPRWPTM